MMIPPVLERVAEAVRPAMNKAVSTLDVNLRTPVEYHLGWVEPDGTPRAGGGGKGVRPALAILGAEAARGRADVAIPGAVAIELIHNFSLVHDDIIDGDRTRRHRRTVWDVYGAGDAIIIGDALHTLAFEVLLADGGARQLAALRRLGRATSMMIAGQAQDTALDRRADAQLHECLEMEANKTGALLSASVAIGAILAGADDELVSNLDRYGSDLGLAFQAIDDVLGVWGDPEVTGKPVGSDLRERKKSMPVAIALGSGGSLASELRAAFACDVVEDDAVAALAGALESAGIRAEVEAIARDRLASALDALDRSRLDEPARAELEELARFVVERVF